MIISKSDQIIDMVGGLSTQMFGIDELSLPIIFDILRNKMYSNPIAAICREIPSNSRDANRENGIGDKPITITMVKDFLIEGASKIIFSDCGKGMSPEIISEIYTKYGASTKRVSNDLTGGFGLGSKTPFAYTDTFFVDTRVNGELYKYMVYIDESGLGATTLMVKTFTDLENGTDITIPLRNESDAKEFENFVAYYTMFWNVKPELNGIRAFDALDSLSQVVNTSEIYTLTNRRCLDNENSWFIIDGIPYEISSEYFKFNNGFVKFINNGVVSIPGSRENLQYDNKTKEVLKEFEDEIKNTIKDELLSFIDDKIKSGKKSEVIKHIFTNYESKSVRSIVEEILKEERNEIYKVVEILKYTRLEELNFSWKGYVIWQGRTLISYFNPASNSIKDKVFTYTINSRKEPIKSKICCEYLNDKNKVIFNFRVDSISDYELIKEWLGVEIAFLDSYYSSIRKEKKAEENGSLNTPIKEKGYTNVTLYDVMGLQYYFNYKISSLEGTLFDEKGKEVKGKEILLLSNDNGAIKYLIDNGMDKTPLKNRVILSFNNSIPNDILQSEASKIKRVFTTFKEVKHDELIDESFIEKIIVTSNEMSIYSGIKYHLKYYNKTNLINYDVERLLNKYTIQELKEKRIPNAARFVNNNRELNHFSKKYNYQSDRSDYYELEIKELEKQYPIFKLVSNSSYLNDEQIEIINIYIKQTNYEQSK